MVASAHSYSEHVVASRGGCPLKWPVTFRVYCDACLMVTGLLTDVTPRGCWECGLAPLCPWPPKGSETAVSIQRGLLD